MPLEIGPIESLISTWGRVVTLQRYEGVGPARAVAHQVANLPAIIRTGAAELLVSDVQMTGDMVEFGSSALTAAGFPGDPVHGDILVYDTGAITSIEGNPDIYPLPSGGRIYKVRARGA